MSIYQHFRPHEHPFVDQVQSWQDQVMNRFIAVQSDFLDPRDQQIIESLIGTNNTDMMYAFFGGSDKTERKRAIIAPFYEEVTDDSFDIVLLEATFESKFITIQHRDILGSFMSLGIDRKKIGDIYVADDRFQFFLAKEISPFVQMNLTKVKNTSITLREKAFTELIENNDEWIHKQHTVSSLRLDVIVKEIYQMSRKDAAQHIKANRVKVNFTSVADPAMPIIAQDLVSVRGLGRSKVIELHGKTRKDKWRITSARLKA